jgi:putative PIG3 family NAD(P)H quinone oxidoreductase
MSLPAACYAIECRGFGGPEVMQWAQIPMPVPEADEVLLKIAAAGLNNADLLQRRGKYPPPPGASPILGMEASGVVAAIGNKVTRWKVGDKVCALLAGGGYAEYAAVAESQCLSLPSGLSLTESAALPEGVFTVWANIFESGALKPGETVLVHGGAGGIGSTAIQMIKAFGARVITTVSNTQKAEACLKYGADSIINYKESDFVEATLRETGKKGADIVLDILGGDYVARNLSVLAPLGRHVSIATQAGGVASVDMREVMKKRLTLTGSTLRSRDRAEKARLAREIEAKVWPWVVTGKVKPLIYKTLPIKNAAEAHKMMESGQHIGKITLEVAAIQAAT